MPWSPLPRLAFAICIYPWTPAGPNDLPLQIGDELYLIETGGKDNLWYRGYLVAPPSLLAGLTSSRGQHLEKRVFTGIFPAACVEIRELLGDAPGVTLEPPIGPQQPEHKHTGKPHIEHLEIGHVRDGSVASSTLVAQPLSEIDDEFFNLEDRFPEPPSSEPATSPGTEEKGQFMVPQIAPLSPQSPRQRNRQSPRPAAPVPMLKISDESELAKKEPLIDEIASCLREWHSAKLHELLLNRQYGVLHKMSSLVNRLDYTRRQLLHNILTSSELERLREQAVWDLSRGNKLLSGGVIVRSKEHKGRILTADDSAIEVTKLQAMMSLLDAQPHQLNESKSLYQIYVNLKSFTPSTEKPTWLELCLYKKRADEPAEALSECFSIDTRSKGAGTTINFGGSQKTLFTDIAPPDVGEANDAQSSVFLVVKMITSEQPYSRRLSAHREPLARQVNPASNSHVNSGSRNLNSAFRTASIRGGRQSLMWGRKGRKDSEISVPKLTHTGSDHGAPSHNQPSDKSSPKSPEETRQDQKPFKRVTGCAVIDVSKVVQNLRENSLRVDLRPLATIFEDGSLGEDARNIAREVLGSPAEGHTNFEKSPLVLQLKAFDLANYYDLIQSTPTLFHNAAVSQRLGFAGAPHSPRSDIYFTLKKPDMHKSSSLRHTRDYLTPLPSDLDLANLIITLEVRSLDGQRLENAIWPASSRNGHGAWRTYAIQNGEMWNQTVRLAIDPKEVSGAHIVMSLAEGYDFPFALCWMPLWEKGAFISESDRLLNLWRYDDTISAMRGGKGAYLEYPWEARPRDLSIEAPVASVQVRTFVSSTVFSQNPHLLALLHWKGKSADDVKSLLKDFSFVPDIETVKLLKDVLDALFGIVVEFSDNQIVEDLVFNGLVMVLAIVHDRRFNSQPIVDEYAQNDFNYPFAFPCLLRSMSRLLEDPTDPEKSRSLRSAFKVGAHIFKFMIKSRQQQVRKEVDIGISSHRPTLAKDLSAIFAGIEALMKNDNPVLVGTKTLVVQHFHAILPELRSVMNSEEILTIASNFVSTMVDAEGKLVIYKLLAILHISDAELFPAEETRNEWIASVADWISPHWGKADDENYTTQWRDQTRLCSSIVATFYTRYGSSTSLWARKLHQSYSIMRMTALPKSANKIFSPLFPTSYPFPTRHVDADVHFDEALLELSALLAETSDTPPERFPQLPADELANGLRSLLDVTKSILDFEAFPPSWISLHIYHHRSCLRFMHSLYGVLTTRYLPIPDDADNFNVDLWRLFLLTLIRLVSSRAVALEAFTEQQRRAIWKIGGDIRESGAELLWRSWHSLGWESSPEEQAEYGLDRIGGYQVPFVPALVGPIVELCLSVHEGLRDVAVGVLRSMIVGEWTLNGNLDAIQTEMIDKLDNLYKSQPLNDGMLQKIFIDNLGAHFHDVSMTDVKLRTAVQALLHTTSELLDLLVAVYVPETSGDTGQSLETLRLLEYFKALGKLDIYIGYVHRLVNIQLLAKNYVEAGIALKLHADLLEWDSTIVLPSSTDPDYPLQTAFERKEQIYFQMIRYYEEASAWHQALAAYTEIAAQYMSSVFDYAKLARSQRAMATIYERISRGERKLPRYFRVVFRGMGFSSALRDRQFIYEAPGDERMAIFTDQMQQRYPNAHFVGAGEPEEIEGQYISIFSINVHRDFDHPVHRHMRAPAAIKDHLVTDSPNQFSTTTRKQANSNSVRDQIQAKLLCTTADTFPTILRRSEIIHLETISMTPVQIGIERSTRKTHDLMSLVQQAQDGVEANVTALTEQLMILVSPKSTGGVAGYWELLDVPEQGPPQEKMLSQQQIALRTALVDHLLAIRAGLDCYTRGAHQATKLELEKDLEVTFGPVMKYYESVTPGLPSSGSSAGSKTPVPEMDVGELGRASTSSPLRERSQPIPRINTNDRGPDPVDKGGRTEAAPQLNIPKASEDLLAPLVGNGRANDEASVEQKKGGGGLLKRLSTLNVAAKGA